MAACAILKLPFPPSVNRIWRYVNGRAIRSREYREWIAIAHAGFLLQPEDVVSGAYTMHVMVNRPDNRRRDITNVIKAIEDVIVSAKYVDDDALCQKFTIEWVRGQPEPVKVFIKSTNEV